MQTDSAAADGRAMRAARNWSLFDRQIHDAHFAALRQLYQAGADPASAATASQLPPRTVNVTHELTVRTWLSVSSYGG